MAPWGICILAIASLSACGGTDGVGVDTRPPVDYASYAAQATSLHNTWDSVPVTDPANLPVSGTAQFNGVAGLRLQTTGGELKVNGALGLNVDFASDSLSGSAGGFSDESNTGVSGTLAITGGVIDRLATVGVEYTYTANIGGTLAASSDSFAILGDIYGDFSGAGAGAALGIVAGTAQSGYGTGYVFGDFIASQ